jgi:hypothetical protein
MGEKGLRIDPDRPLAQPAWLKNREGERRNEIMTEAAKFMLYLYRYRQELHSC